MKPGIDQDLELRIRGHLHEIAEINDDVIGSRQGFHMAEAGYIKTLVNVAECTDESAVDDVADWIKEYIRDRDERPKNRRVRRIARKKVTDMGYPANDYLNAA
jgi:hypothetical protein